MPQRDRTLDERIRSNEPERPTAQPRREPPPAGPPLVSALGNAAVQRLLRATQSEEEAPAADDAIAGAIEAERGGGQALDEDAAERFGRDFGADLSGVRVHEDSASDVLNKAVQAEAFTTGADIFFREGQYQPGSTEGDRLLAHELTHVVQQESSPAASGSGLEVSDPQDASEREADAVAQQLTAAGGGVERQVEEEEELMMSPALDRQVDEEEELMMSPALDRQVDEEEELMMSPALDRQVDEEEELMMSPALRSSGRRGRGADDVSRPRSLGGRGGGADDVSRPRSSGRRGGGADDVSRPRSSGRRGRRADAGLGRAPRQLASRKRPSCLRRS